MRKYLHIIFILLLLFAALNSFSQKQSNSELLNTISTAKADTSKVLAYYKLARSYGLRNLDSCLFFLDKGYLLAQKNKDTQLMIKGLLHKAEIFSYADDSKALLANASEALRLSRQINDKKLIARCFGSFQAYYSRLSNKDSLDKYTRLTINAWKEAGDTAKLINSLVWSNHYYRNAGYIDDAIKYTSIALRYSQQFKDSAMICEANWCLAVLQRSKGNYRKQLVYLDECLRWFNGKTRNLKDVEFIEEKRMAYDRLGLTDSCISINERLLRRARQKGDSLLVFQSAVDQVRHYITLKNAGKAEEFLDMAIQAQVKKESYNYFSIVMAQIDLYTFTGESVKLKAVVDELIAYVKNNPGSDEYDFRMAADVCYKDKRYKEALYFLDKCYDAVVGRGIKDDYNNLNRMYAFSYAGVGDYKKAYDFYLVFDSISQSIYNEHNSKNIEELDNRYQSEKKALMIQGLQDQKLLAQAELKRQNVMKVVFGAAFVLGLILVLIMYRAYVSKRKDNALISLQKSVVEEKNKEVLDSINYAKKLQDAILPPVSYVEQYLPDSFILYRPKDIVAGDFYWMHVASGQYVSGSRQSNDIQKPLPTATKDHILFAVADCTGHGVPGALVSVVCSNALDRAVKEFRLTDPGAILDKTRALVIETFEASENDVKDGMDISLCSIDTFSGRIKWSGAYNPLWYFDAGELKEVTPDKQPVGKTDSPKAFATHTIELEKGAMVYLFTDGFADQFGGPQGKKFKYKQLKDILKDIHHLPAKEQTQKLDEVFAKWKGELEQVDDVTIMGIRL
jgi:serine phosphatase RsbU (regulator of sigma subunit)